MLHSTKQLAHTYIFENVLFTTTADQQGQQVVGVRCRACFWQAEQHVSLRNFA